MIIQNHRSWAGSGCSGFGIYPFFAKGGVFGICVFFWNFAKGGLFGICGFWNFAKGGVFGNGGFLEFCKEGGCLGFA